MYFSIAWGLNPRLLKMNVGNKTKNVITFFLGSSYKPFRMTVKTPLLDRRGGLWRGAEGDETEAGVVDFLKLIPPPRRAKMTGEVGQKIP